MIGYMNCPSCDGDTITLNAWVDDDGVQCGIEQGGFRARLFT